MPPFKNGVTVNYSHGKRDKNGKRRKKPARYLMIKAGPQRGQYVHDVIMEAVLGRKLEDDETVEHIDGNGLNVGWNDDGEFNLKIVTKSVNTRLRYLREQRARQAEAAKESIPFSGQF